MGLPAYTGRSVLYDVHGQFCLFLPYGYWTYIAHASCLEWASEHDPSLGGLRHAPEVPRCPPPAQPPPAEAPLIDLAEAHDLTEAQTVAVQRGTEQLVKQRSLDLALSERHALADALAGLRLGERGSVCLGWGVGLDSKACVVDAGPPLLVKTWNAAAAGAVRRGVAARAGPPSRRGWYRRQVG